MGIFDIFKKKAKVVESDTTLANNSDVDSSSKSQIDTNNLNNESSNNQGNFNSPNDDINYFKDNSTQTGNDILFTNDDYINDLNIDTSYYESLLNEETPSEENVSETESEENQQKEESVFNLEKGLEPNKEITTNSNDAEVKDVTSSDVQTNDGNNENLSDEEIAKKNSDLFSYLDDPFLVDNFLNRDSFSFQKFLEDKKKESINTDKVIDLEDEEQRLQFIKEIESNIIDDNFQKASLIDSSNNAEINNATEENEELEDSECEDVACLEGDELYKEKPPSSKDEVIVEEEIMLDDIIIPETKTIPKAPTNNFRDFFAEDSSQVANQEEHEEYFDITSNDDPLFLKDTIKHNFSLNTMHDYTKEEPMPKKVLREDIDTIEDFYDFPQNQTVKRDINVETDDENNFDIDNEVSNNIKERKLIDEIKQRFESQIVMDAKQKHDEENAVNKRPNFNDELIDLLKKGYSS
ncbi:MAG: hypothetical protein RSE95_01825 [Malacoplasma sp.]